MNKTTVDLTDEQLRYLRGILLTELLENQKRVRLGVSKKDPDHVQIEDWIHEDIRTASQLITILPEPRREGV